MNTQTMTEVEALGRDALVRKYASDAADMAVNTVFQSAQKYAHGTAYRYGAQEAINSLNEAAKKLHGEYVAVLGKLAVGIIKASGQDAMDRRQLAGFIADVMNAWDDKDNAALRGSLRRDSVSSAINWLLSGSDAVLTVKAVGADGTWSSGAVSVK